MVSEHDEAGAPGNGEVLRVEGLRKVFAVSGRRSTGPGVVALDGISFDVKRGETVALVGESGCGKTTAARCILRLVELTDGDVRFRGESILGLSGGDLLAFRRRLQIVFQDPYASLDPRMTVASTVGEPLAIHQLVPRRERRQHVDEILGLVGISPELSSRKPHAFSGGQRQRIAIARALIVRPELVILDEPVTALDVSVQAQVLNLLSDLQRSLHLTYVLIVHDLAVAEYAAHRVVVLYRGKVMELAATEELFRRPLHPYTAALLSAIPQPDPAASSRRQRIVLQGDISSGSQDTTGCRFAARCPIGRDRSLCRTTEPPLVENRAEHWVACHFPGELAPPFHGTPTVLGATQPGAGRDRTVPDDQGGGRAQEEAGDR
jgi:peptide/nickel transport system ATP-binding protein/oligopeptide transport system ATP-binding protein